MNKAVKSTFALAASAVAMASVVATPSLVSAWGDNGGGRPSYTIDQINKLQAEGKWGNKVVFNSISDSVMGNEKNFVGARENTGINAGANNVWNGNDITVKDGQEYLVRLYVHNNNPNGYNGVSRDTRVAFNIPTISAKQVQVNGYIYSSNATPSEYWDYVNFNSDQAFHLEYVYGSALIENRGYASQDNGGAKKLSDEIVTKAASNHGVMIGFDKEGDGIIPGCFGYDNFITIRVKAVFDTDYRIEQRVRLVGTTEWKNNIEVKAGDKVEFRTQYLNTSNQTQNNVMIKNILPKNLSFVPGSTKLINGSGTLTNFGQDSLFTTGVNIGHYNKDINALVDFTAVVSDENLPCGSNTLVSWAQGGVGNKTIQDYASVTLNKVCENTDEPETPAPEDPNDPGTEQPSDRPQDKPSVELPNTGASTMVGSVIGLGSIATSAGYYIASRRALHK